MSENKLNLNQKLSKIQGELKVNKSQYNNFGKYKYRNCEDILEAVKPLLLKYELSLNLSDEVVQIGERYYVKSEAGLSDGMTLHISASAMAREAEAKKGMDESQITGAASSYARKYALCGLFCIDDGNDADSEEKKPEVKNKNSDFRKPVSENVQGANNNGGADKFSKMQINKFKAMVSKHPDIEKKIKNLFNVESAKDFNKSSADTIFSQIQAHKEEKTNG